MAVRCVQIYEYNTALISVKDGTGRIINGHFKLVHVIDLSQYQKLIGDVTATINATLTHPQKSKLINFRLQQLNDRIESLSGRQLRKVRSINWIGSAWKWLAGSPDAADWNEILRSEEKIVENNNQQYKINEKLFSKMETVLQKVNRIINDLNNHIDPLSMDKIEQDILNQLSVINENINEIIRACQLAKSNIINTNIIDKEEINQILSEMETLPYQNEIEAVEHGTPSVYVNGSMLLYVLAIPKLRKGEFNLLHVRPAISRGKRVDISYKKMLVNQEETYGITGNCLSINNCTICELSDLELLENDDCLPKLLKGGDAKCQFRTGNDTIVEIIKEGTIFVTNYEGALKFQNTTKRLNGTYVIQLFNETIELNGRSYSSILSTKLQVLPPVLTNIINRGDKVDVEFVHELSINNIRRLGQLTRGLEVSGISSLCIFLMALAAVGYLWNRVNGRVNLPDFNSRASETGPNTGQ